jgi:hypothetical protein
MKIYNAIQDAETNLTVTVNGQTLQPRLSLCFHSPSFGGAGAKSSQLALAILSDYYNNDCLALAHHMEFKWFIELLSLTKRDWDLTDQEITNALKARDLPYVKAPEFHI